jgi:hypothetical protein
MICLLRSFRKHKNKGIASCANFRNFCEGAGTCSFSKECSAGLFFLKYTTKLPIGTRQLLAGNYEFYTMFGLEYI